MIVGILGGIGSGKSTVTRLLLEQGAEAVDADAVAHEVIQLPEIRQELRSWMGDAVFRPDGQVDRRAVAERVFSDPSSIERLESLLHPRVEQRILRTVERFRRSAPPGGGVLVLDVSLLGRSPLRALCDQLLFVDAAPETRRKRTASRGWGEGEHERREALQLGLDEKRRLAGRVIDNSGSLEDTRRQVRRFYQELLETNPGSGASEASADSVPSRTVSAGRPDGG